MKTSKSSFNLFLKICLALIVLYFGSYYFFFGDWQRYFNRSKYSLDIISSINHSQQFKRDSLFTIETIHGFIDSNYNKFNYYSQFNVPVNRTYFWVDTILYSPDSLKLIAFVIEKIPNVENNKPDKYFYSGSDMIAFRASRSELWKMYYWGEIAPTGFKYYNEVRDIFYEYYFNDGKFKTDYRFYWDSIKKEKISIQFKYNLDNTLFWDSSIVWQKGSRIPGYYSFQTNGNVTPASEHPISNPPQINYSSSLLKLFENQ